MNYLDDFGVTVRWLQSLSFLLSPCFQVGRGGLSKLPKVLVGELSPPLTASDGFGEGVL